MKRFATISEQEIEQKRRLLTPKNTTKCETSAANVLRDYLTEKGMNIQFETFPKKELDTVLSKFYLEARTKDGQLFKKSSIEGIRYSLNRFLKKLPNNETFDLLKDTSFAKSNDSFKLALQEIKNAGRAETEHHEPLSDSDRQKLYTSLFFNTDTPTGLYNKVQFDLRYYFANRGAENMHTMTKTSFRLMTDSDTGLRYVRKVDAMTKNHRENESNDSGPDGRMVETHTADCPVESYLKYLSKLHPNQDRLWCYPKDSYDSNDECWFTMKPVGVNTLRLFLSDLSKKCGLSQVYTNHSIRTTTGTLLHQSRFSLREMQSVTGHKSIASLAVYQRTSTSQKLDMAQALHSKIAGQKENTQPRSAKLTHSVEHAREMDESTAEGGEASLQLNNIDLNTFFSEENEPGAQPLFQNCRINIQNFTINYVNK